MTRSVTYFDPTYVGETDFLLWDFTQWTTEPSNVITLTPVITVEVLAGVDPSPQAFLTGTPIILAGGQQVTCQFTAVNPGVTYLLCCTVQIGGITRTMQTAIAVIPC